MLILAVLLGTLGISFYYTVQKNMQNAIERQMTARATRIVDHWNSLSASEQDAIVLKVRQLGEDQLTSMLLNSVLDWKHNQIGQAGEPPLHPIIINIQKQEYFTGRPIIPWDEKAYLRSIKGETLYSVTTVSGVRIRVLSTPIYHNKKQSGVIQVARTLSEMERDMKAVATTLMALIPIVVIIVGIVSAVLTSGAVMPVRELKKAIEKTEAENLSNRLPVTSQDEFGELAAAYNRMLERLEDSFKRKDRFIADASHELRTPLTIIRGNTSIALSKPRSCEEYIETIKTVNNVVEDMSSMVNDLLLLARADAGNMLRSLSAASLSDLIEASLSMIPSSEKHPIEYSPPQDDYLVYGSEGLLVRLFANILTNAVVHSPNGCPVKIETIAGNKTLTVIIQDHGEGIAPEHLERILDRFYQVDPARSQAHGGNGLGLAICKSIAEAHNGSIDIKSEVGVGTSVSIQLPRYTEKQND
jgi:heavy metal sensor kinase